ncbi:MAG: hypothetical protein ACPW61_06840 [Methyloligella sp. ZOD6]
MTNRGETSPDQDNTPIEGSAFTPRQVRILKIAVIVMGVLLVGGFLLIIATIAYRATQLGVKKTDKPTETEQMSSAPRPEAFGVAVPDGAEIADMAVDGDRLALHLKTRSGNEIMVIDLTSGAVVSRIRLKPE